MENNSENNSSTNIFDLSQLASVELQHQVKKTSGKIQLDEQNRLLQNYTELQPDKWNILTKGDHIRYLRKDGSFRRGGFFTNSWIGNYGNMTGKQCIELSSSIGYNTKKWTICTESIDKIWLSNKSTSMETKSTHNVDDLHDQIELLNRTTEQLKIDIVNMGNEQKRIINALKQIYTKHIDKK